MTFTLTDEQQAALDLFENGDDMVIEAGAGTGKTSTLIALAETTDRRGQYVAFNKAIVTEAERKLPDNVAANTAHSLAFRAHGKQYAHRLRSGRTTSRDLARRLNLEQAFTVRGDDGILAKRLEPWFLASTVKRAITNFSQSADLVPDPFKHISYIDGIDTPNDDGTRTYVNNDRVREFLAPFLAKFWADVQRTDGQLPFGHEHYLKLWQLSDPVLAVDFILFDEAQDANPVIAAIVEAQREHAQRVYVGDSQQAIYGFTGAVNAMAGFDSDHRTLLTQSFRFGDVVANTANLVLDRIPSADLRLRGFAEIDSIVDTLDEPHAILTRTNARAVTEVLDQTAQGRAAHLVGGGGEIAAFARGAQQLIHGNFATHQDLACFSSWTEVQDYVANDPQGSDLKAQVKLIDDFGPTTVLEAVDSNVSEKAADVIVSTAHKSKGREWSTVRIADDFPPEIKSDDEYRLLYVAVTRAQHVLDDAGVAHHYRGGVAA